ncbi:MAG: DUF1822 family protein [Anaerolineae bacterium]|nr:DUF1822 family protein [Gloeobacterales cyanobacterium ES-bin-313]
MSKFVEEEKIWTPKEIAAAIGRSHQYVINAISQEGKNPPPALNAQRSGSHWLISSAEAQRFIELHLSPSSTTDLKQWLSGQYSDDWKSVDTVVKWRVSFRNAPSLLESISRAKKVRLDKLFIGLIVFLASEGDTFRIRIRVSPIGRSITLPPRLILRIDLAASGESRQVQAGLEDRWIQLDVQDIGQGENLNAIISLEGFTFTEYFEL